MLRRLRPLASATSMTSCWALWSSSRSTRGTLHCDNFTSLPDYNAGCAHAILAGLIDCRQHARQGKAEQALRCRELPS